MASASMDSVNSLSRLLVAQGVLRVQRQGRSRYVMIDVDLGRLQGLCVRGISPKVLVTSPEVLPAYAATEVATVSATTDATSDAVADDSDWLAQKLLDKPIEDIGLQERTCLELWHLEILTVRDLLGCSEEELSKTSRGKVAGGKISPASLDDVLERLSHYGLKLNRTSYRDRGQVRRQKLLETYESSEHVSPDQARAVLGDKDFELFERLGSQVGNPDYFDCRNTLLMRHHRLSWKEAQARVARAMFLWERGNQQWLQYNEVLDKMDLYQEGLLGMTRAIEGFDHLLGFRFATYAKYWVEQTITRAINDSRGVPSHELEALRFYRQAIAVLGKRLDREPTEQELAAELDATVEKIRLWRVLNQVMYHPISLDDPVKYDYGEAGTLGNIIADYREQEDIESRDLIGLRMALQQVLHEAGLLEVERRIVDLYYGLTDGYSRTMEQVGDILGVTRSRIQQRLEEALPKLQTEDAWEALLSFMPRAKSFVNNRPGMRWELAYSAWQAVRQNWSDAWTPGTALYQVCLQSGVAFSDFLEAPLEEKKQPLGCLLMAICRNIFYQSFEAIADRFNVPELIAQRCCKRCLENFRRLNPLFDDLVLPDKESASLAEEGQSVQSGQSCW